MAGLNNLYYKGTANANQTTLNGSITSTTTTITVNSTANFQNKQGAVVLDRTDANGNSTPTAREWVAFDSISGSNIVLTDTTRRGRAGSTAQSHSSGALVEEVFGIDEWNGLLTSYTAEHKDAGTHTGLLTDTLGAGSTASVSGTLWTTALSLNSVASGSGWDHVLPWTIPIEIITQAFDAQQGPWVLTSIIATSAKNVCLASTGTQNDYIQFQVVMAAGTWAWEVGYRKFSSAGIAHLQIDGVDVGTIDCYSAATVEDQFTEIGSISVSTSGKHAIKILMSTKNASSSSYAAQLISVQLRRTA